MHVAIPLRKGRSALPCWARILVSSSVHTVLQSVPLMSDMCVHSGAMVRKRAIECQDAKSAAKMHQSIDSIFAKRPKHKATEEQGGEVESSPSATDMTVDR